MSFLKSIGRIFNARPIILKMSIAPTGVRISLTRNATALPSAELYEIKDLPNTVIQYLRNQPEIKPGEYVLPFMAAKRLIKELQDPSLANVIKLDVAAIEALQPVAVPANFRVQWRYNENRQALARDLVSADGYLGMGCFYQGTQVWRLDENFSLEMLTWLGKSEIPGSEFITFIERGLKAHPSPHLSCDLRIETGFRAELKILKLLKQSMDVQVTTNRSGPQASLTQIYGISEDLLIGNTIIPGWGRRLHGLMLTLAQSGEIKRLSGDELAGLIFDHGSNFAELGLSESELARIRNTFKIYDGTALPVTWELKHQVTKGIGAYRCIPGLKVGDNFTPIETIGTRLDAKARFSATDGGWIALTSAFRARYSEWQSKGLRPVTLQAPEILGSYLERLNKMSLKPPQIDVNSAADERDQAILFFDAMRRHGLPAAASGFQNEIEQILAQECKRLLQDQSAASILWIVPRRRLNSSSEALKAAGVTASYIQNTTEGRVTLLSSDSALPSNVNWTLLIFIDLDLLVSGDAQARIYGSLSRQWAICTFSRTNWAENESQAARFIRVLGLGSETLAAFVRVCARTFSNAPTNDGLLNRMASSFKTLVIGEDRAGSASAVPIPKPPQPPRPEPKQAFRPSIPQIQISTPTEVSFLTAARQYAQHTERPAEFVPFSQYFPTYKALSPAQSRWYFYWRSEVRKGNYLPTDLSYLFLHIYEVIHLVGFDSAPTAFNYLAALWRQYRVAFPQLDNYLIDWLADFLVVYTMLRKPLEWYSQVLELDSAKIDTNLAVEAWLATNGNIVQIPDSVLDQLSDYNYRHSKFYMQYNADSACEAAYREALRQIDSYLQTNTSQSLFNTFHPANTAILQRQPFAGAIYEGRRDEITIATLPNWAEAKQLRANITSIIKYTENLLRHQRNYKGSLREIELSSEWAGVLDKVFPSTETLPKPPHRKHKTSTVPGEVVSSSEQAVQGTPELEINFSEVEDLLVGALKTQELLTVEDDSPRSQGNISVFEQPELTFSSAVELVTDGVWQQPINFGKISEAFAGDQQAITLLRFIYGEGWTTSVSAAQSSVDEEFLTIIVSRVNGRALDVLGDKLIFLYNDTLEANEDYRDDLAYYVVHRVEPVDSDATTASSQTDSEIPAITDYSDLTPELAAFAQLMQPPHWEALNVLVIGEDVAVRLDSVARHSDTMVSLLINDINDMALRNIGDIVIDSTVEPPMIEEYGLDDIKTLNTWAQRHRTGSF